MIELALLGGITLIVAVGILLNPEVIPRLPWIYVVVVMPTIVLVTVGHFRKKWQHQRTERALDGLMELRYAKGSDAVVEAAGLYEKLRKFKVRDHINASKDFISVTRTAGPHQIWCLRLTLHHAFPDGEPWCSILREHEAILRAGPIPQEESERLDLLVTPSVSMRERYGMGDEE